MALVRFLFGRPAQAQDTARFRPLLHWDPTQVCSWPECSAKATSEYQDKVYCPRHLLTTLHQQWQE
jgi:hypothetical protein